MPNYYTCEEVAQMYKVKVITVWSWIRTKKLSAMKLGRDYRITDDDLKAFDARGRIRPASRKL